MQGHFSGTRAQNKTIFQKHVVLPINLKRIKSITTCKQTFTVTYTWDLGVGAGLKNIYTEPKALW